MNPAPPTMKYRDGVSSNSPFVTFAAIVLFSSKEDQLYVIPLKSEIASGRFLGDQSTIVKPKAHRSERKRESTSDSRRYATGYSGLSSPRCCAPHVGLPPSPPAH